MYEIKRKNCYKCDVETMNDSDGIHFLNNLRDFEIESENNWNSFFVVKDNKDKVKYRKQLTKDIHFQPDIIFIRNDLFKKELDNYQNKLDSEYTNINKN